MRPGGRWGCVSAAWPGRRARVAGPGGGRVRARRAWAGAELAEAAVALPILLLLALGLVQFAMLAHAQHVLIGASQDGARRAAAYDGSPAAGAALADGLLRAGLGDAAGGFTVAVADDGATVTATASGHFPLWLPIPFAGEGIALRGTATQQKERWHGTPR